MPQPFHVSGAAAGPLLYTDRAGINLIRTIFYDAFSLIDSTGAERVLTRWNLVSTVFPHLLELFWSLRHYTRIFFTSAVTIKAGDELYFQVFNWLVERESRRYFIKEYSAHTLSDARSKSHDPRRRRGPIQREPKSEEASQIKFTPAFKTTWFFYGWNLFAILRNDKHSARKDAPGEIPSFDFFGPMHAPKARDSVTITCLGWSIAPIRALLETCREMAEAQKQTSVTILSSREGHWSVSAVKPVRPLDTVYLNDDVKKNLMSDLEKYLDPKRRQFYSDNGIPYRRGYLLHGPPGCGKSSLSLALAGYFGLDLYIVNFGSIHEYELASLFAMLPARCFVLLEDIDAVGFRQKDDDDEDDDENENNKRRFPGRSRQKCSFSGLLNVLDGIASQEGRVVIMTSNFPDKLDEALVRPGRIDVKVYMGHMTRQGAEQIFLRMMKTGRLDMAPGELSEEDSPDHTKAKKRTVIAEDGQQVDEHQTDEELQILAEKFSKLVPEETFTPAQLQGYLLRYLHSATTAVDKIAEWAVAEQRRVEDDAQRKKKKAKNAEKRKAEVTAKGEATSEGAGRASRLGSSPIYIPAPGAITMQIAEAAIAKMKLERESSPDSSDIDRIFGLGDESNTPESRE
ncbi:P-loop containing nucleoside triphosphate hydrolase protein [Xylaria flabelliformis]|nr:P-loop containing nucleoside triphosphate hydrolase protein [Xylaria flabelliformis]